MSRKKAELTDLLFILENMKKIIFLKLVFLIFNFKNLHALKSKSTDKESVNGKFIDQIFKRSIGKQIEKIILNFII